MVAPGASRPRWSFVLGRSSAPDARRRVPDGSVQHVRPVRRSGPSYRHPRRETRGWPYTGCASFHLPKRPRFERFTDAAGRRVRRARSSRRSGRAEVSGQPQVRARGSIRAAAGPAMAAGPRRRFCRRRAALLSRIGRTSRARTSTDRPTRSNRPHRGRPNARPR